jgi:hypothetical protein
MNNVLNHLDTVIKTYMRLHQSCIFVCLLLLACIQKTNEQLSLCSGVFILENIEHFCNFCLMLLYGCATWCLKLREEQSLVSEDTVLSKIMVVQEGRSNKRRKENSRKNKFVICTQHQTICEDMKIYSV